jgi:hypothetical protein
MIIMMITRYKLVFQQWEKWGKVLKIIWFTV